MRRTLEMAARRVTVLLLLAVCFGNARAAEPKTDTIQVQVTDSSRAAVPGTKVTLIGANSQTISTGQTDGSGSLFIGQLASGSYDLLIERDGFAPEKRHITLSGSPLNLLVSLVPAAVNNTVTVTDKGYAIETANSATRTQVGSVAKLSF